MVVVCRASTNLLFGYVIGLLLQFGQALFLPAFGM